MMRWCYDNDVPLTARGGGTGLAGGAIPVEGGVVIGFERLNKIRQFDPLLWRMHVEAGVDDRRHPAARARERPALPARPGRSGDLADRRQHRLQRRRAARVQVRRHRQLGDRARGR